MYGGKYTYSIRKNEITVRVNADTDKTAIIKAAIQINRGRSAEDLEIISKVDNLA